MSVGKINKDSFHTEITIASSYNCLNKISDFTKQWVDKNGCVTYTSHRSILMHKKNFEW